eukprot:755319-Hanusia_phi.AAC.2
MRLHPPSQPLQHGGERETNDSLIMSSVKEYIRKELQNSTEPPVSDIKEEIFRAGADLEATIEHEKSFQLPDRSGQTPITMSLKPDLGMYSLEFGQELMTSTSSLPLNEHAWPPISITNCLAGDMKDAILS